MAIKLVIGGCTLNMCSVYAPQVGLDGEEKKQEFQWSHRGSTGGYGDVHGGYGFGERNDEGVALLDFARAFGLVVVNLSFPKKEDHLVTFRSAIAKMQIDFLLLRKGDRVLCKDCKVIPSENISTQHRLLVIDLGLKKDRKRKGGEGCPRIKWGLDSS
ncbi:uncharacterized protein LOC124891875 [Capsicum annuum]|uniref:uncharacterized protein LOC124891875 n=1 Tax=Capsicum annuum TaxID=4072 RepID=UPI001FB100B0|nr:uncharacterized protein LOC124891875 [Capsicum annuum]